MPRGAASVVFAAEASPSLSISGGTTAGVSTSNLLMPPIVSAVLLGVVPMRLSTQMRLSMVSAIALAAVGTAPAGAGFLESDYSVRRTPRRPPVIQPPRPIPPPVPWPRTEGAETIRLLDRLVIHPPVRHGALTVFPLTVARAEPWRYGRLLSLGEALAGGQVEVKELHRPRVERARFVNRSPHFVYVMGGEVILGGKQNRAVRHDALLAPHSDAVLELYCVQQGRWDPSSPVFRASPSCLPRGLRDVAARDAQQEALWAQIRTANRRLGVRSRADDFQAGFDSADVQRELHALRRRIVPRLPWDCVGVVVARGRQIIGADVFFDAALFRKLRSKVLDSYGYECVGHGPRIIEPPPTARQAKRFLDRVYAARFERAGGGGAGRRERITGAAFGGVLVYGDVCMHLDLRGPTVMPLARPRLERN